MYTDSKHMKRPLSTITVSLGEHNVLDTLHNIVHTTKRLDFWQISSWNYYTNTLVTEIESYDVHQIATTSKGYRLHCTRQGCLTMDDSLYVIL